MFLDSDLNHDFLPTRVPQVFFIHATFLANQFKEECKEVVNTNEFYFAKEGQREVEEGVRTSTLPVTELSMRCDSLLRCDQFLALKQQAASGPK